MDELNLENLAEYIDAMALVLDLPIPAAHRSQVVENFAKLKAIAQTVNEFTLPPEIEAAAVFEP